MMRIFIYSSLLNLFPKSWPKKYYLKINLRYKINKNKNLTIEY